MTRRSVVRLPLAALALITFTACTVEKSHGPIAPADIAPASSTAIVPGCTGTSAAAIVECERAKFAFMDGDTLVTFLKATAQSLNRNEIPGGPYGVLRKPTGSNCGGYSCDIICAGQGASQRQHDVLLDSDGAQQATWGDPETVPHIRVDVCDVPSS